MLEVSNVLDTILISFLIKNKKLKDVKILKM